MEPCSNCGSEVDVESTFCGSMCAECRQEHAHDCEVCRADFAKHGLINVADLIFSEAPGGQVQS